MANCWLMIAQTAVAVELTIADDDDDVVNDDDDDGDDDVIDGNAFKSNLAL